MTNKEEYAVFCQRQTDMPVMMQAWWLDAVCAGKTWDVVLVRRSDVTRRRVSTGSTMDANEVLAAMPYLLRKRLWYKFIVMPQMTLFGGIWLTQEAQGAPELQEQIAKYIAKQLRAMHIAYYEQNFAIGNPMPYWLGKQKMQTEERVTYRIDGLTETDEPEEAFSKNKKRQLERAETLTTDYEMTAEEFYRFHAACIAERGKKLTYTREFLLVLERKTRRANQSAIIRVSEEQADGTRKTVAAAFVVWDKRYMYYLIPAFLPSEAKSGASARLADETIRLAKEKGLQFDFEGGNDNEGIANHYRQFGAKATAYQSVRKMYRPSFALLLAANKWWSSVRFF